MDADTTLRDDLTAVMAEKDTASQPIEPPAPAPVDTTDPPPEVPGAGAGDRGRDDKGRFAKKQDEPIKADDKPVEAPKADDKPVEAPKADDKPKRKAPQSWRPAAREVLDTLPEAAQEEALRRDKEITHALQESSEARKFHAQFREAVGPFEAMIRAEGGEPLGAVKSLLQTAAMLRTAPAPVKARAIAGMINQFLPGQDGLTLLEQALIGQMPQQGQPMSMPQPQLDPRVDKIVEFLQLSAQQRSESLQQRAEAALEEVRGAEFYDDVREDMADILELSAKRGVAITVKDAYNRAVALHPEISQVLERRKLVGQAPNGSPSSRAAASSVRPSPATAPQKQSSGSLREDIEEAMRASQGR
jgi:hypothetical protein